MSDQTNLKPQQVNQAEPTKDHVKLELAKLIENAKSKSGDGSDLKVLSQVLSRKGEILEAIATGIPRGEIIKIVFGKTGSAVHEVALEMVSQKKGNDKGKPVSVPAGSALENVFLGMLAERRMREKYFAEMNSTVRKIVEAESSARKIRRDGERNLDDRQKSIISSQHRKQIKNIESDLRNFMKDAHEGSKSESELQILLDMLKDKKSAADKVLSETTEKYKK